MKIFAIIALMALASIEYPIDYRPDDKGSTIAFRIKNFGFEVKGSLSGIQGMLHFDEDNPQIGTMDVTVDAGTINTGNSLRDKHLKDEGYLDILNYPVIHFASSHIRPGSKSGTWLVDGQLTMKGKSKSLTIPFSVVKSTDQDLFRGSFTINRREFGVGGASTISDELVVDLQVLALKD